MLKRPAVTRHRHAKPPLQPQVTTLWDYPSQDYGDTHQGLPGYKGATPSYIIWNLIQRYTKTNDLVVDCFCGSGTTLDVARDPKKRPAIEAEIADVVIYALEFANICGIDLAAAIEAKMAANAKKYPVEKAKGRSEKYTEL